MKTHLVPYINSSALIDLEQLDKVASKSINLITNGQFHIGEHLMAKNNLQNSLQFLVLMYR